MYSAFRLIFQVILCVPVLGKLLSAVNRPEAIPGLISCAVRYFYETGSTIDSWISNIVNGWVCFKTFLPKQKDLS